MKEGLKWKENNEALRGYIKELLSIRPDLNAELFARTAYGEKLTNIAKKYAEFIVFDTGCRDSAFHTMGDFAIKIPRKSEAIGKMSIVRFAHEIGHLASGSLIRLNSFFFNEGWMKKNILSLGCIPFEILATIIGYKFLWDCGFFKSKLKAAWCCIKYCVLVSGWYTLEWWLGDYHKQLETERGESNA